MKIKCPKVLLILITVRPHWKMTPELMYIELKSGFADDGPAWIGIVEMSKSGRTLYFNGSALKSLAGSGIAGNYYDLETGDEYWISRVKKDGSDRHWSGTGKVQIDRKVVDLYLQHVKKNSLNKTRFELCDVKPTDKQKFAGLENKKLK